MEVALWDSITQAGRLRVRLLWKAINLLVDEKTGNVVLEAI